MEGFSLTFSAKQKEIEQLFDELSELNNQTRKEAIEDYLAYYQSKYKKL